MKVTLWTIQDERAWRALNTTGVLRTQKEFIDANFKFGYTWMKKQMEMRLPTPNVHDTYPVWAWYQYRDARKRKPDLRCAGHLPRGSTGYRIEFLKEKDRFLSIQATFWEVNFDAVVKVDRFLAR